MAAELDIDPIIERINSRKLPRVVRDMERDCEALLAEVESLRAQLVEADALLARLDEFHDIEDHARATPDGGMDLHWTAEMVSESDRLFGDIEDYATRRAAGKAGTDG